MDRIIVYMSFYNPIEANIVKSRLLDSGVQCFLTDENTITINPLYTQALGGVKLHIFEKEIDLVNRILADDPNQLLEEELQSSLGVCPNCGSSHIAYVHATEKKFSIPVIIVSFLLMVYPFYARKTYHCFDCKHEFAIP